MNGFTERPLIEWLGYTGLDLKNMITMTVPPMRSATKCIKLNKKAKYNYIRGIFELVRCKCRCLIERH